MPILPHPPVPGMPGIRYPLSSTSESLRVQYTEQNETVCSLKLWERVNRRRTVCGFSPLTKDQRSARDLAIGLWEMRGHWIKGENWDEEQPGDDPLLLSYMEWIDYPTPRTTFASISFEGVGIWTELRVPKMAFHSFIFGAGANYQTKHNDTTKTGTVSVYDFDQPAFTMEDDHGLSEDQVVDIMWRVGQFDTYPKQGCRIGATVKSVDGNTVTVSGGYGNDLPTFNTKCFFMTDREETITVHVWKLDPNPTCEGVARVVDRMIYTGISRRFDSRLDESTIYRLNNQNAVRVLDDDGYTYTINQYDNEFEYIDQTEALESEDPVYTKASTLFREPALRWDTYSNVNAHQSIRLVMRDKSPDNGKGRVIQMIEGYGLARGVYVNGLSWDGIVYGRTNPNVFDTGSEISSDIDGYGLWIPISEISSYLPEAINASQTTFPLPDVELKYLPSVGGYHIQIDDEIMLVGGVNESTQVITVTRGALDSTPSIHNTGAVITYYPEPTDYPYLEGMYENWNNGTLENAPFPRSWMKDFAEANFDVVAKGEDYEVTNTINHIDEYELGGAFFGSMAIPDWTVYHPREGGEMYPGFNHDPPGLMDTYLAIAGSWIPIDTEEGAQGHTIRFGTLYGYGETVITDIGSFIVAKPVWNNEMANYLGGGSLEPGQELLTKETIYVTKDGFSETPGEGPDWPEIPNIYERLSSLIGPSMLRATLHVGWQNTLSEFDITAAMGTVSSDVAHDYRERVASVGVSGNGITNFQFNRPEWAEHGAEIYVWRRRIGTKTTLKYGEDLFEHSVKDYQYRESMYWLAGIELSGPVSQIQDVLVTYNDIIETAETIIEAMETSSEILPWSEDLVGGGLPSLGSVSEDIPDNYVTSLESIVPGEIFSVSADFDDFYAPFIKYNFEDDNTGHEDGDGFPPGVKPV